ncbi:antitermination protein [Kluyvera genomosp. 3]|uniref:Antitermination protein n=1 Tax=Kluyvera genomosp. 3 TaxID=2774055 RepID=A0A6G9RNW6_9ENTR|nr:antitermination protein [Kluyvera genomosp. 3]QIR27649.1 antitermination protein [Kluyvera genomosp. 3]
MSRKTVFNGTATGRRRKRRSHLQNSETISSELLHRPTLSRAQIQAKGAHHTPNQLEDAISLETVAQRAARAIKAYQMQIERAVIVYQHEFGHTIQEPGACLSRGAIYAVNQRRSRPITAQ